MEEERNFTHNRLSRFEAILITAIMIMAVFFIVLALEWPKHSVEHRDDALWANTALSAATVNSNNGTGCVVNGCPGGDCEHRYTRDGVTGTVGYFDPSSNTIVADKPAGYNEERTIRLNGDMYRGPLKSMVLEVRAHDGEVTERWVDAEQ